MRAGASRSSKSCGLLDASDVLDAMDAVTGCCHGARPPRTAGGRYEDLVRGDERQGPEQRARTAAALRRGITGPRAGGR
jgi:hypothetical protein